MGKFPMEQAGQPTRRTVLIALRNNNRCHRVICAGYYPAIITLAIIAQIREPGKLLRLRCVRVVVDGFVTL